MDRQPPHDRPDPALRDALRAAASAADFDAERLGERIAATIAERPSPAVAPLHGKRRTPALWLWTGRAAAAALVFLGGALYGRLSAPAVDPAPPVTAFVTPGAQDALLPAQVGIAIQAAGTGYVASLALLSEMRERLTVVQREQARQVALAVLTGALAELAAAEDGRLPNGVLRTVLSHGVTTGGPGDPVVRVR